MPALLTYCKAFLVTAATTYPFIGLVAKLSDLQSDRLMPCNEHSCSVFKVFPDKGSPSTFDFHIGWPPANPFYMVRNGEGFAESLPPGFLPSLCPSMQELEMRELCADRGTSARIINPLEDIQAKFVYIWGVFGWFLFKVVHDWMLLGGCAQSDTLKVGLVSVLCQLIAVASGFSWCMGAAEVFIARIHDQNCACYYQLPEEEILLAIGTPSLLFVLVISKLDAVKRALVHGDYLYFTQYDIPYHLVVDSVPDPSGSLLVGTVAGSKVASNRPLLTPEQMAGIAHRTNQLLKVFVCIVGPCVALAIGPLTARLMGLTTRLATRGNTFSWHGSAPLLVALVLFLTFILAFHVSKAFDERLWNARQNRCGEIFLQKSWGERLGLCGRRAVSLLMHAGSTVVLIISLGRLALGKDVEDDASNCAWWAFAGLGLFLFGVMEIIRHILRPARFAMFVALRDPRLPPAEYVALAEKHEEFGLSEERRIAQAFLDSQGDRSPAENSAQWWSDWKATLDASPRRGGAAPEGAGHDETIVSEFSDACSSESSDGRSLPTDSVSD